MPAPKLEHTYASTVPTLSRAWTAQEWPDPELVVLNEPLAAELGLDAAWLRSDEGIAWLTGNGVPETTAQAYAGHQFGHFAGVLGDGRALLLGELPTSDGGRVDLHLKGSGRTPFSRGGDGLAALGPMLREYLVAEGMHALGIPTARALAVVSTGMTVQRERPLPGAVLCRVASSHLRIGTFQLAAALQENDTLRALTDHAIDRHHPSARDDADPALALLRSVATTQAQLVARWMLTGFVHGVMNTDNTTISGETIDYGPCAFMDTYDPHAVFSSIDRGGRYAYDQQPAIIRWNIARLAEALLPMMQGSSDQRGDAATEVVHCMAEIHQVTFDAGLARKLGVAHIDADEREQFLTGLADARRDFTDAFPPRHGVNPIVIPRNHLVQESVNAAEEGDLAPFNELLAAVTRPWDEPEADRLKGPPPVGVGPFVSYCGT